MNTLEEYIGMATSPGYNMQYFLDLASRYINPEWVLEVLYRKSCNHYICNTVELNDWGDVTVVRHCIKCGGEDSKCVVSVNN